MRFDDSLDTVLAADASTPFGAQSAWRQLTDLVGRRRVASAAAIERLRVIRPLVPPPVRAASARSLAFADPPAGLVALFADDEPNIAAPVIGVARLDESEWLALLPAFSPTARGLLRHRRDLPTGVRRALDAFGTSDFALPQPVANDIRPTTPTSIPAPANDPATEPTGPFAIAELVARLDAYERESGDLNRAPSHLAATAPVDRFCFETDAAGMIRWVEDAPREPLVGVTLGSASAPTDGIVAGAVRRRAPFADARLTIPGSSAVAGDWQLAAIPAFDPASGRFLGYRGSARRPRADERAEPRRVAPAADALRTLVHELRTPTNAISGFAEMIEGEILGPAPQPYREMAGVIRGNTRDLLDAIDDIDIAARMAQGALSLRPALIAVAPLLASIAGELEPLLRLRGATLDVEHGPDDLYLRGDEIAIERLVGRLLALNVRAATQGERLTAEAAATGDGDVTVAVDRAAALAAFDEAALLGLGADEDDGLPLGVGFTLRLVRNLAAELGGSLTIGARRLTLRLPAALDRDVGQLSSN